MDTNGEILEEKDKKIAQLERQLIEFELKEARQQIAATIAVDHNSSSFSLPKGILKYFLKAGRLKIILAIVILVFLVVITAVGIRLIAGNALKQNSITIVEQVQELATLATAKAHTKAVIQEKDNKIFSKDISINLPGTKREILFIVPGTIIAGVNLKGVTSRDMVINEKTKEIDITLPRAELIQDASLQMDKKLIYVNGGLFTGDFKLDDGFDLVAKAQEQIREDAISVGLFDTAEQNAENALKGFFKNIGYKVNVTFN
ncbi:DUF4230 domain-containing protein [Anaerobacillus alkaliphilus]|uniref:DUF4230 domain-containing protein n=1 Tax=Anaerobacillus alkaliphilus TaxID=1548597 RepID=A0A4Q0VLQ5_9BACI|nr:DUF4230 domain-containing protein [Anaerobacillus alkaliphilus]RXI96298.1 DUF4230 domain-containing protein [Anaerobacillus alkaliphilus]